MSTDLLINYEVTTCTIMESWNES